MGIIKELEAYLKIYDKVLLLHKAGDMDEPWLEAFCQCAAIRNSPGKVLILSTVRFREKAGFSYRHLSDEEEKCIMEIYGMYEFSGRFSVISRQRHYGSLFHYVDQGMLTMEEMCRAVLA